MATRVLFYVQHLMGVGHVFRATRLIKAMAAEGLDVDLVMGGEPIPGIATHGARVHQLPPVRAGDEVFNKLVDPAGDAVSDAYKDARRDMLLGIFRDTRPDILMTEAFPFGRRQMRFELLPLMEAAKARADPPVIVASVRDIVQENSKPGRDRETVDLVNAYFDRVLVHGDPALAPFDQSFPLAGEIADKLVHTGIVAPDGTPSARGGETFDVIVSVGGGALGHKLLLAAAQAKPLSVLRDARWLIVTGIRHTAEQRAELLSVMPPEIVLRDFVPDLPGLLARATLSISRAGYNTVADLFVAGCRAVVVPLSDGVETEQIRRAEILRRRDLVETVAPGRETAAELAAAIDRAVRRGAPDRSKILLDGAERSARLLVDLSRGR